jgi:hypothetical protein
MPLQNRVTPEGEIVATPHRGLLMGNRGGAFHQSDQTIGPRRWASRQWIACVLEFKGRHREAMMRPNRYTELFFLDEATALAAGHRPCFECRRADADRFAELWAKVHGGDERARAPAMDEQLHAERVDRDRRKVTWRARRGDVPSGAFVRYAQEGSSARPYLVMGNSLLGWDHAGYTAHVFPNALSEEVEVLTPASIAAVLAVGYRPMLHPSAAALLAKTADTGQSTIGAV